MKYFLALRLRSNAKASIHPDLWPDKEQRTFFWKNVIRRYMSSDNVKRREREKENGRVRKNNANVSRSRRQRSGEMDFREFSMGYRLWAEKEMRRRLASGRRDGRRENVWSRGWLWRGIGACKGGGFRRLAKK